MSIVLCKKKIEARKAKNYLGLEYTKVPYLYTNLHTYGVNNRNVNLWLDISGQIINAIYLKYFDCLHFYSRDSNYPYEILLEFLDRQKPQVVMLEEDYGKYLKPHLSDFNLSREYTIRFDLKYSGYSELVEFAKKEDLKEIAELMMCDSIYQTIYTTNALLSQLVERFEEGYGKCFIIKQAGKIVTSYCINGENDKFFFLGSLIVHPSFRRRGFGSTIIKHTCEYIRKKERECLAYIATDNIASLEQHKRINALPVGMIYKFHS